jgi:HEAT repeat protein
MVNLEHIWIALEDGRFEQALDLAEQLFVRDPHAEENQQEAAQQLLQLYQEQLRVEVALRFEEEIVPALGPAGDSVLAPLREELDFYHFWRERLAAIAQERLVDEFLSAVKAGDNKRIMPLVRSLIATALDSSQRVQRARQIGSLLGGLVAERERAAQLIKQFAASAGELGLDGPALAAMFDEFERARIAVTRRENVTAARSKAELTQAIVELSRALPDRMALHEPRAEEMLRFEQVIRAIVAVGLTSPRHERYYEASLLFVEFSPKELSTAGALAGVEQRLYSSLGRTARLIASRTLEKFGGHPRFWSSYERFAKTAIANKRYAPVIVEVIGLLRNPAGTKLLLEWLNDPKLDVRNDVINALGFIGDSSAVEALLQLFARLARGKILGESRREAAMILSALGRALRGWDTNRRSNVMHRFLKLLPKDDFELSVRAALTFLSGSLEGMDPALLEWGARIATRALWRVDSPELARQAQSSPLGFRQPLIDLLVRLAPYTLDTIVHTALEEAKTFSGAYLALAELCEKVADPRCLALLRQLLLNTFLHEDKPRSAYQKETIIEPGSEERTELTKDKVLAALIYAVSKIPSPEADELLADLFERVRSGRLPQPGREVADVLMQAYMKVEQKRGAGGLMGVFPGAQQEGASPDDQAALAQSSLSKEEVAWINDLDKKFLLASTRRAKRVAAMHGLASRRTLAAIPKIIKHLTDKDAIIAAAAETALVDYGAAPVRPAVLERLHSELLAALRLGDSTLRQKVAGVLKRLGPRRSSLKDRLEALLAEGSLDGEATRLVRELLAAPPAQKSGGQPTEGSDNAPGKVAGGGSVRSAKGPAHISALEKKRQYLLARQAWIRGGKKGPEPQPPE